LLLSALAEKGVVCVSVDYRYEARASVVLQLRRTCFDFGTRLSPETKHPGGRATSCCRALSRRPLKELIQRRTALNDFKSAYSWLTTQGLSFLDICPNRIAIGGQSAGAMLASVFSHSLPSPTPRMVVLESPFLAWEESTLRDDHPFSPYYIVTDEQQALMKEFHMGAELMKKADKDLGGDLVPLLEDDSKLAKLPPHYISVSELDSLRDQGLEYASQCRTSRAPSYI
jgi:alpha/beta hydrolase fold